MNRTVLVARMGVKMGQDIRMSSLYSVENVLSKENIERTMERFASLKPIRLTSRRPIKRAAVLIPVCVVDGKVSLLYTQRAAHLKSHRGQVSFPGGMQDGTDPSLEATALRECEEELNLRKEKVKIWGTGNEIITRQDTLVLPVVGQIEEPFSVQEIKVNPQEVKEVFTVPLEELCDPVNLGYTQFKNAYSTPVFKGGHNRIWGLTAVITNLFLKCFLPSKAYSHKIKYIPNVTKPLSL